jgi:leucyl aminopeptidase (aminopeptidase T)
MIELLESTRMRLEKVVKMKPGQNLLVISDTHARSKAMAQTFAEVANSIGIRAVVLTMDPLANIGQEPPPCVGAAMKSVDVVLEFGETSTSGHSTARKEATEVGVKYYVMHTDVSEDYWRTPVSIEDLERVKTQTERFCDMMTRSRIAKVTTPYGTDITMSLERREAIPIHPLTNSGVGSLQDYAEAAISPVEGTTEGLVAVDASVRSWGYVLRTPIRFEVKKGRVQIETVTSDVAEEAEKFKAILRLDENASNCAAELGLGTSHTASRILRGDVMGDYGTAGHVHLAVGRNNDIGGETYSKVHNDVLMTRATVALDGVCVIENGEIVIK